LASQLRRLADAHEFSFLAYLLAMAVEEGTARAEEMVKDQPVARRRKTTAH
jgi:hypothetical protein